MPDTKTGKVVGVFVAYDEVVTDALGQKRIAPRTADRGEEITISAAEYDRLEGLGMIGTGASAEAAIARALAPTDPIQPLDGEPVSVSPPPLGQPPAGDLLTGDTGAPDTQPEPSATASATSGTAPSIDVGSSSVEDVAAHISDSKLNATETVALAGDDPANAQKVLEAEQVAQNGDPRKSVVDPLDKIVTG